MKLKVICSVVSALAVNLANAGVVTIGGVSFDEANSVQTAAIVEGPVTLGDHSNRNFARFGENFISSTASHENEFAHFDRSKSIGRLLGRGGNGDYARHVSFGGPAETSPMGNVNRSTIELTWGDRGLVNQKGPDFVVFESGNYEVFAVSGRKASSSDFSSFRYQFANDYDKFHGVNVVAFDLSDLGFADGEVCSAIRIRNVFNSMARAGGDRVDNESGQGKVVYPSDPNYKAAFPMRIKAGGRLVNSDELDADIVYVAGLHNLVPLPAPATTAAVLDKKEAATATKN